MENVVLVGGDAEAAQGHAHFLEQPAGEHVAEITGRHDELDLVAHGGGQTQVGPEVIHALGEDAGEVDGIDRAEAVAKAKLLVGEELLERSLGVVEGAGDGESVNVFRAGAGHLALLERRGAAVGIEDEDGGAGLAEQAMNGGRAGVAGGGAEHVDRLTAHGALVAVEVAEELEGEVFEGERGAVEELEHVGLLVELHDGRDVGVGEGGVALVNERAQRLGRDVGGEAGEELVTEFWIRERREAGEVGGGEGGERLGQVKAAVGREAGGDGVGEAEGGRLAAGGDVAHGDGVNGELSTDDF